MIRTSGGGAPPAEISVSVDDTVPSPGEQSFPFSQRTGSAAVKRFTHAESSSSPSPSAAPPPRRGGKAKSRWGPRRGGGSCCFPSSTELCFYCFAVGLAALLAVSFLLSQVLVMQVRPWLLTKGGRIAGGGGGGGARFVPLDLTRRFQRMGGLDRIRREREGRQGIRPVRLAVVVGAAKREPSSLMLVTLVKAFEKIGYSLSIFSVDGQRDHLFWKKLGFHASILTSENCGGVDWSIFDGVILGTLEGKLVVSSLFQEPFLSIPLIWIIQNDILANRLPIYMERAWDHLLSDWRSSFSRANAVVFPDFSLAMLHSALDIGNFYVIAGYPVDAWAAKVYRKSHSKLQLRRDNAFDADDIVVLVIGSSFLDDNLYWEHAASMHALQPVLTEVARVRGLEDSFKFLFLCGNSSGSHSFAFQEITSHLGFSHNSIRHYGFEVDVNGVMLMADVVLYASFHDEHRFPSLLQRAMFFGIPIIAPDFPIIKKYVVDSVNGLIYSSHDAKTLTRAFSSLVSDKGLSELAHSIAASGKSVSENLFALDCVQEYAKLLENVIDFPSEAVLPHLVSEIQQQSWEWSLYEFDEQGDKDQFHIDFPDDDSMRRSSVVFSMEEDLSERNAWNFTGNNTQITPNDYPSELDWKEMGEIDAAEEFERRESEEVAERMERTSGSWEVIYNTARKSEKKKFEVNERDEGELERIGSALCIYEVYNGPGTWPFLHHATIYRGISLVKGLKRSKTDDVDAVDRLPLLHIQYYKDLLCEFGGMLSIANKVDMIHKTSWIGFQSWRGVRRKFSLSVEAEKALEDTIVGNTKGDIIYFWAKLGTDSVNEREHGSLDFWTMCDIANNGNCRIFFEEAFRKIYGLSNETIALPPMPNDGDDWSAFNSWVMPTPSFLEFMMFSRMFVDSLHNTSLNSGGTNKCLLGSSSRERKHCYCRVLELIVNVWAYHSGRKIVYVNPVNGDLKEQHPIEKRKGIMWVKYFNFRLLQSMDEDLAEDADDGIHSSSSGWLWPLTGEVHWQGILDREREERYRAKMDKRRKNAEKLKERQKHGYKQKALGG